MLVGNELVSDFLEKANLFNGYFSKQRTMIDNNSAIPANTSFVTEERLSSFETCSGDIVKIIRSLDTNKAHGHDKISVHMIEICASSISKPLVIVFLKNGRKLTVPVHKKHDKQLTKNYRPLSLLPVFSNIFEKVTYNSLFKHLDDNNL